VDAKITFCRTTVKTLTYELHLAWQMSERRRIKRLTALVGVAERQPVLVVAERLGVCPQTIYHWVHAFLREQWASLRPRRSPGRPSKLTPTQRARLRELLTAGPEAAGYPTGCWNTALIQDLIQREFHRSYNVHYLATVLHNLGFSYQKGRFVSDHLDEARRQQWLTVTWPTLVQEARQREALLLFADEASFAQWGSLGYTWALRGQQPLIKTCGIRKGYKVWGLIEYWTGQVFYQGQTERFTAARSCAFLTAVLAATAQPVILIQDGARYHTAAETRRFMTQHAARLTVYQLPSYSPDYNPIEHLWRHVKRERTHNRYFPTFERLVDEVEAGLASCQQQPTVVKQLMGSSLEQVLDMAHAA
jgi:transposase